jgi:foldase protein PrsA
MKSIIIAIAVIFGVSMFAGLGFQGFQRGKERRVGIATINGKQIDQVRFNQNLTRMASEIPGRKKIQDIAYLQMLALGQVIDFTLMLSDAKRHVRVSGGEVDGAIRQIMEANKLPTRRDFDEAIKRSGFEKNQFKKMLKEDIYVQKMAAKIKGGVVLNPEDLREIRASHILISPEEGKDEEAKKLAEQILERVKKGEDFAALAKEYSDDPGNSDKGGDLGYFTTGRMLPEFEKVAFALKPGEVSGLVKTQFGYHIIKLTDSRLRSLGEGNEGGDLKEVVLEDKKENAFGQWLYTLKQDAKIEIISPILRAYDFRLRGQADAAIAEYNIAISENPSDGYLHILLGDVYDSKGEIDIAIAEYVKATTINASDPDALITLGRAYEKAGKRDLAIEQYKKVSILAGESKELHEEVAEIYKELGEKKLEAAEREKIKQIEKKAEFEAEIQKKLGEGGNSVE